MSLEGLRRSTPTAAAAAAATPCTSARPLTSSTTSMCRWTQARLQASRVSRASGTPCCPCRASARRRCPRTRRPSSPCSSFTWRGRRPSCPRRSSWVRRGAAGGGCGAGQRRLFATLRYPRRRHGRARPRRGVLYFAWRPDVHLHGPREAGRGRVRAGVLWGRPRLGQGRRHQGGTRVRPPGEATKRGPGRPQAPPAPCLHSVFPFVDPSLPPPRLPSPCRTSRWRLRCRRCRCTPTSSTT